MPNATDRQSGLPNHKSGWLSLCLCVITMTIVWLLLLPALSHIPSLQAEIENQKARGIDASAMFYTDLDMMDEVLERLENARRKNPTALWLPSNQAELD